METVVLSPKCPVRLLGRLVSEPLLTLLGCFGRGGRSRCWGCGRRRGDRPICRRATSQQRTTCAEGPEVAEGPRLKRHLRSSTAEATGLHRSGRRAKARSAFPRVIFRTWPIRTAAAPACHPKHAVMWNRGTEAWTAESRGPQAPDAQAAASSCGRCRRSCSTARLHRTRTEPAVI